MRLKFGSAVPTGLVFLFTLGLATCAAAQFATMTTHEAAGKARTVVHAKVLDVQTREQGNIYTFVELETIATAKGEAPARFTYRMLGGRVGGVEVGIGEPLPSFTPNEEVVLFLGPETSHDGYPTIFMRHVYRVAVEGASRTVSPAPSGLTIPSTARAGGAVRLDAFLAAIGNVR